MITKSWPADIDSLSSITAFIEKLGQKEGLSSTKIFKINLSLEEVVVNIINYGFSDNTGEVIRIDVQVESDQIIFSVIDSGRYFDPLDAKKPDITLNTMERPIGGLGVFLVKKFASQVGYERRGNENIFTMTIKKNG